ncbi:hypothetical protein B0H66DRAFT_542162 [Apodospora peruviana]|uniref:Uncharacterized protein n=1 Tax=Apodospora peruviana TaxID=516989 RepID=A0AAE0IR95_9PEZI|nr:hypothetical protein B0H66DRAFT_542162 [Apodospora peruviana]
MPFRQRVARHFGDTVSRPPPDFLPLVVSSSLVLHPVASPIIPVSLGPKTNFTPLHTDTAKMAPSSPSNQPSTSPRHKFLAEAKPKGAVAAQKKAEPDAGKVVKPGAKQVARRRAAIPRDRRESRADRCIGDPDLELTKPQLSPTAPYLSCEFLT